MTANLHARLWRKLPSPYPEISVWGSDAGPFTFVVSYNSTTQQWSASFKRAGATESATFLGRFESATAAYEACEKYYRASLS
jgi:hypothetical protein